IGNTGERKTLALAQLARSQRDAEQRRDAFSVLAEGFVEISEPEQHDGIGVLTFDPLILLEDGGRLQCRRLVERLALQLPGRRFFSGGDTSSGWRAAVVRGRGEKPWICTTSNLISSSNSSVRWNCSSVSPG